MFTFQAEDDFLTKSNQEYIEEMCNQIPWYYNPKISGIDPESVNTPKWINMAPRQNGFESMILGGSDDTLADWLSIKPLIEAIDRLLPFDYTIIRARAGMFLPTPRGGAHVPHVDFYFPHYTLLYYVNDSDGDTILYNEKVESVNFGDTPEYPNRFTLLDRISPKRGTAVLFNGMHYHSSSLPKKSENRIAININIVEK